MPGLSVDVYECQVRGVYENDRLIDAVSQGGRLFHQISYLLPWISANGNGLDLVPQTGDQCVVLASPVAKPARQSQPRGGGVERGYYAVCIGFKVPVTPGAKGQTLGQRKEDLPQGSLGMRVLTEGGDEALLLITRGGTAIIGSNVACRTVYSPVDSSIIHVFNKWEMVGPAGFVRWTREEGQETARYRAEYRTHTQPSESTMVVNVDMDAGAESPVAVTIHDGNLARPFLRIRVASDGEAYVEGEQINIIGRVGVNIDGAEVKIKGRQVLGQGDPI